MRELSKGLKMSVMQDLDIVARVKPYHMTSLE